MPEPGGAAGISGADHRAAIAAGSTPHHPQDRIASEDMACAAPCEPSAPAARLEGSWARAGRPGEVPSAAVTQPVVAAIVSSTRKADNGVGRPVFALPVWERAEVQVVLPEGRNLRRARSADGG